MMTVTTGTWELEVKGGRNQVAGGEARGRRWGSAVFTTGCDISPLPASVFLVCKRAGDCKD